MELFSKGEKMKRYEMDMCSGPLFGKLVRFLVPLILSGVLLLAFNGGEPCGKAGSRMDGDPG